MEPFHPAHPQILLDNNGRSQWSNTRFLTISSLRRALSSTRTLKWPGRNREQITCNVSSAYHVLCAVCHLVRRDSSAIKFDRVKIVFILALFHWLIHLLMKEGMKPEYLEKTPDDELQKMPHNKARKSQILTETRTRTQALVVG